MKGKKQEYSKSLIKQGFKNFLKGTFNKGVRKSRDIVKFLKLKVCKKTFNKPNSFWFFDKRGKISNR